MYFIVSSHSAYSRLLARSGMSTPGFGYSRKRPQAALGAYSTSNKYAVVIKRITLQRFTSFRASQYMQISGNITLILPILLARTTYRLHCPSLHGHSGRGLMSVIRHPLARISQNPGWQSPPVFPANPNFKKFSFTFRKFFQKTILNINDDKN